LQLEAADPAAGDFVKEWVKGRVITWYAHQQAEPTRSLRN